MSQFSGLGLSAFRPTPIGSFGGLPFLSAAAGSAVSSFLSASQRHVGYLGNDAGPIASPPIDVWLRLYWAGRLDNYPGGRDQILWRALQEQGVARNAPEAYWWRAAGWNEHYQLSRPILDPEVYRGAYLAGKLSRETLAARLKREGITGPEQLDYYLTGTQIGIPQTIALWLRKQITDQQFRARMLAAGVTDDQVFGLFAVAGLQLPSVGDLIRFSVRGTWDAATVARLDLASDLPGELRVWAATQGWDWGGDGANQRPHLSPDTAWSLHSWYAARTLPGVSDAWTMRLRLSGAALARYQALDPALMPFGAQEYDDCLRAAGYPDRVRHWLQAASYTKPRITTIRTAVAAGLMDRNTAEQRYLEYGLLPDDAALMADIAAQAKTKELSAGTVRQLVINQIWTLPHAERHYLNQGYSAADAHTLRQLDQAALDKPAKQRGERYAARATERLVACIDSAYDIGVITSDTRTNNLQFLGLPAEAITQGQTAIDQCHAVALARTTINVTRGQFLRGEITLQEATSRLILTQVTAERIQRYLAEWAALFTPRRKSLATADILDLVKRGLLDETTAAARLANLGWVSPDAILLLSRVQQQMGEAQAKAADALARQEAARAKQLQAAAAQAKKLAEAITKEAVRQMPVASLKKWLKKGEINEEFFRERLVEYGYEPAAIDLMVKEVKSK